MAGKREVGRVKWFDTNRGYGFISRRGAKDVFVHANDVQQSGLGTLDAGDTVSFTVKDTAKGPQAENLERATTETPPSRRPKKSAARPSRSTDFRFGPDYLADGYFKDQEHKYLRPEVVDELAMDVARLLGNRGMKSHQFRRFFNKARGIETRLDRIEDFEAVKADIYGLKRDVAYQVGRGVVPEEFQHFIDRNVELSVQDERSFTKGFLEHFESVLAYFVYYFRE